MADVTSTAAKAETKADKAAAKVIAAAKAKAEKEKVALDKKKKGEADAKAKAAAIKLAEKEKVKAVKAEATAKTKAEREAKKAIKEAAKNKQPDFVEQLDVHGNPELVDKNKFPFEIICSVCGSIRYVNKSGLGLVTMCKKHAVAERRKRRTLNRKGKVKMYTAAVKDALAQNLFPPAFKKKYGLE